MRITHDKWHEAAFAAANLARYCATAHGASGNGAPSRFHTEQAAQELNRVANALGFTLAPATATAETEAA